MDFRTFSRHLQGFVEDKTLNFEIEDLKNVNILMDLIKLIAVLHLFKQIRLTKASKQIDSQYQLLQHQNFIQRKPIFQIISRIDAHASNVKLICPTKSINSILTFKIDLKLKKRISDL